MRKTNRTLWLVALTAVLASLATAKTDELFSVKEYGEFHHLMHPLQHEALPAKDFQRIRSNSPELVKRGRKIVRVGVPKGTAEKYVAEFRRELENFEKSLDRFAGHSQSGTDDQLEVSFSAVHDSFEMLAGMLPRKSSN